MVHFICVLFVFLCVAIITPALLGPAMPAFPPGVVWGSAGEDGHLMALPESLRAAGLWLGLVPP